MATARVRDLEGGLGRKPQRGLGRSPSRGAGRSPARKFLVFWALKMAKGKGKNVITTDTKLGRCASLSAVLARSRCRRRPQLACCDAGSARLLQPAWQRCCSRAFYTHDTSSRSHEHPDALAMFLPSICEMWRLT